MHHEGMVCKVVFFRGYSDFFRLKRLLILLRKGLTADVLGGDMVESEKIRELLDYYKQHNNEHAEKYMELANKATKFGNEELSRIFVRLYLESKRLNRLFEAAKKESM